jgi:hypothetical protein
VGKRAVLLGLAHGQTEGDPEARPADGFEKRLLFTQDPSRPGQVSQERRAESLLDRSGHGAGTVAEVPIEEERKNALCFGLSKDPAPIADGAGKAQDVTSLAPGSGSGREQTISRREGRSSFNGVSP